MNRELYQSLIGTLNNYYPQIGTLRVSTVSEAKEFWNRYGLYKLFGPLPAIDLEDKQYLENLYFLVVNYSQTLQDFCLTLSNYVGLFFFNPETNSNVFTDEFFKLLTDFLKRSNLPDLSNEQKDSIANVVKAFSSYELFPSLLTENLSFNKQKLGVLYRKALTDGLKNIPQDSQEYYRLKDLYTRIRNKAYEFFTRKNRRFYELLERNSLVQIYESSFNSSFEKQSINVFNIDKEYKQAVNSIYRSKVEVFLDGMYFSTISEILELDENMSSVLREYLRNAL
jgi:hypothetical protein